MLNGDERGCLSHWHPNHFHLFLLFRRQKANTFSLKEWHKQVKKDSGIFHYENFSCRAKRYSRQQAVQKRVHKSYIVCAFNPLYVVVEGSMFQGNGGSLMCLSRLLSSLLKRIPQSNEKFNRKKDFLKRHWWNKQTVLPQPSTDEQHRQIITASSKRKIHFYFHNSYSIHSLSHRFFTCNMHPARAGE